MIRVGGQHRSPTTRFSDPSRFAGSPRQAMTVDGPAQDFRALCRSRQPHQCLTVLMR